MGCSLIYSKGKSTRLTPEGRQLLNQTAKILESWDQATEAIVSGGTHGTLSVVFSASMAHAILAPVLEDFRKLYPQIVLGVRLEDSVSALQEVEDGRADLAIVIDDNLPKGLKTYSLFRDTLCFHFAPEHPWAAKREISDRDLKEEHFLLYRRDSVTFRKVQELFSKSGMSLRSYVEIPSFDIIKQVAQRGLGVALMAPWVAAKEIAEGSLQILPTPRFQIGRHWKLIHQEGRGIRQAEQDFIACCRRAVQEIPLGVGE